MQTFELFVFFISAAVALNISLYSDNDCQIRQGADFDTSPLDDLAASPLIDLTWILLSLVRSFRLNRTLTQIEQLDFSATSDQEHQTCTGFIESYWNLGPSCRTLDAAATCIRLWINEGLSNGMEGPGWGLNDTTWVKSPGTGN